MLERICTEITAAPWFVQDEVLEREFLSRVVFIFTRGLVVEDKLRSYAYVMARARYQRSDGPKERFDNVVKLKGLVD